jgi:hypothetical protein
MDLITIPTLSPPNAQWSNLNNLLKEEEDDSIKKVVNVGSLQWPKNSKQVDALFTCNVATNSSSSQMNESNYIAGELKCFLMKAKVGLSSIANVTRKCQQTEAQLGIFVSTQIVDSFLNDANYQLYCKANNIAVYKITRASESKRNKLIAYPVVKAEKAKFVMILVDLEVVYPGRLISLKDAYEFF